MKNNFKDTKKKKHINFLLNFIDTDLQNTYSELG